MSVFRKILSENISDCVGKYLDEHPNGVKEYDLLCHIEELGFFRELETDVSAQLLLFQKHFLLFHLLYSINKDMVAEKLGRLEISPILIKKLKHVDAGTQLGTFDALSNYYLNLDNLEMANEDNVNELLDSFWEKFLRNEKRGDALNVLGLYDPVSDADIVLRYRKLVNVHHPDKGGDKDKIQEINEAYAVLIKT